MEEVALDLQTRDPGMKGFSRTSMFAMHQFHSISSSQFKVVPQAVGQLPCGRVGTLLAEVKSVELDSLYRRI